MLTIGSGEGLQPGMPLQVIHQGRSQILRVAAVEGDRLRVTDAGGMPADRPCLRRRAGGVLLPCHRSVGLG